MALRIVRFSDGERIAWGQLTSSSPAHPSDLVAVVELAAAATTTSDRIAHLDRDPDLFRNGSQRTISASRLLSPITDDATLTCQGLNYLDHAAEAGHHVRKENLIFSKASSSLSGPYDDIIRPTNVELLDYEVELGVVLRNNVVAGNTVDNDNIGDFIAGVVLCNDVSARDIMFGASFFQWLPEQHLCFLWGSSAI